MSHDETVRADVTTDHMGNNQHLTMLPNRSNFPSTVAIETPFLEDHCGRRGRQTWATNVEDNDHYRDDALEQQYYSKSNAVAAKKLEEEYYTQSNAAAAKKRVSQLDVVARARDAALDEEYYTQANVAAAKKRASLLDTVARARDAALEEEY